MNLKLSPKDIDTIKAHGLTLENIQHQIQQFQNGIRNTILNRPCTIGDGILKITESEFGRYIKFHAKASADNRISKFVPASGAATRMFKSLLAILNDSPDITFESLKDKAFRGDKDAEKCLKFVENITQFAFFEELNDIREKNNINSGDLKQTLIHLLTEHGLNYSNLPKGLIKFHQYGPESRTPFEEHLAEAKGYASGGGNIKLHFTVSAEHLPKFQQHFSEIRGKHEDEKINFDVTFSTQKPSTDTIAVNPDNTPFRNEDGELVFRPGGHGALLENLNDLGGDIIYIKNIDNVVPDRLKFDTIQYKKILCGYLVELQEKIFGYLKSLYNSDCDYDSVEKITAFTEKRLFWNKPDNWDSIRLENKIILLADKLDRPLRVCGMVKNVGDPGGGPFWVNMPDGSISLQIVEMSQIDFDSPGQRDIAQAATHFNPVDLVCGVKNYKGENFDLLKFRDPDSGFITNKHSGGKPLKALELPGLWNGSMAFWNTIFIEVPITTFNPVKTVNHLLNDQHQQ